MTAISLALSLAGAAWLAFTPAAQYAPTPAHAVLGMVIGDKSDAEIVDGPAPGDPNYPFTAAGGYLSQASAPTLGITVEVFGTARQLANRKTALQSVAPEDTYFNGAYSGGSVLVRVSWWVDRAQATAYGENLSLALLLQQ
jgi:hypothetical protein